VLPHVPLWQVSVAALQVSPAQHVWPIAHEPPCPLHMPLWHTPFVHDRPVQHGWFGPQTCPLAPHMVFWHDPFTHEPVQHSNPFEHMLPALRQHDSVVGLHVSPEQHVSGATHD